MFAEDGKADVSVFVLVSETLRPASIFCVASSKSGSSTISYLRKTDAVLCPLIRMATV